MSAGAECHHQISIELTETIAGIEGHHQISIRLDHPLKSLMPIQTDDGLVTGTGNLLAQTRGTCQKGCLSRNLRTDQLQIGTHMHVIRSSHRPIQVM